MAPHVHPTAIVDPIAQLADDVQIGPFAIVEGPVRLDAGSIVRARAHLIGPLTAGAGNDFGIGCVIGERSQHLRYPDQAGDVVIGSHNVFREGVTVHRSTPLSKATCIGDRNYFMVNAHVAHDCVIGNDCVFVNGSNLAGHVIVEDRVFVSANCGIHQFCRIGRLAMLSGGATISMGVPPFGIVFGRNDLCGANVIGMRRAGLSAGEIDAVRQAFRILVRSHLLLKDAVSRIEEELGQVGVVGELLNFLRTAARPMCASRSRRARDLRDAEAA